MYVHVYNGLLYMQPMVIRMHMRVVVRERSHYKEAR